MSPDFIVDVTEADFEYEVLQYSQNIPVIVDFWASWCQPCKVLGPLLEKLAYESRGAFRLARVDVDRNPNLAIRYNVRSLPTVIAFSQSQPVSEFVGVLPEARVREFLSNVTPPSPTQLAIEKAESLLAQGQWAQSEKMFRQLIEQEILQPSVLLGLAMSLLGQGKGEEALPILQNFPASRQFAQAELLIPYAQALAAYTHGDLPDDHDLDPAFQNCIRLAARGNIPAALDGLIDILRQDRHYRDDIARKVALGLLELLGEENPLTRQYRSELASVLF
ncbi:MAG: thioredoxin [Anaerolineae bacterium]|nr:thioredoxin [Anaerolineae bacterium]